MTDPRPWYEIVPTTDQVCDRWSLTPGQAFDPAAIARHDRKAAQFHRWLAERDAEIEAEARARAVISILLLDRDGEEAAAERLTASQWLAERDAKVAAQALRDAATSWAENPDDVDDETPADARNWLRRRADQIEVA